MILEIALGIVLAVILLALLPLFLIGAWIGPFAAMVIAGVILLNYPSRVLGLAFVITISALLVFLWIVVPGRLASSNNLAARSLVLFHPSFMGILDNKPPFHGVRWLPARILVVLVATAVVAFFILAVLIGLKVAWEYVP